MQLISIHQSKRYDNPMNKIYANLMASGQKESDILKAEGGEVVLYQTYTNTNHWKIRGLL